MNEWDCLCPVNQQGEICFYDPNSHQLVDLLEPARKRPGMYVGSTGESGIRNMLYEVLDFLIEPSSPYHNIQIDLELSGDWITFLSNRLAPKMTLRNSLSLPVAAALSQRFQVSLRMREQCVCRSFEKGILTGETHHPPVESQQIEVRVQPDSEVFTGCAVDYFSLFDRCYTLAALYPGITLQLKGDGQQNRFCFPEGMSRLLHNFGSVFFSSVHLTAGNDKPWTFEQDTDGVLLRGAVKKSWFPGKALSYVNGYPTPDGGTHVEGLRKGIIRALLQSGEETPYGYDSPEDYVRDRYDLAIAVWLDNPCFAGSVKHQLGNTELVDIAADAVVRMWSEQEKAGRYSDRTR